MYCAEIRCTCRQTLPLSWANFVTQLIRQNCEHRVHKLSFLTNASPNYFAARTLADGSWRIHRKSIRPSPSTAASRIVSSTSSCVIFSLKFSVTWRNSAALMKSLSVTVGNFECCDELHHSVGCRCCCWPHVSLPWHGHQLTSPSWWSVASHEILQADCSVSRHEHLDLSPWQSPDLHRSKVPKHRHVLPLALNTFFGHVDISQSEAVFRNWLLLLSGLVRRSAAFFSLLTLRTPNLLDPISSCNHKYATSMCFILPIPCLWRMCSVAFAPMANTSRNPDPSTTTQFLLSQTLPMLQHTALLQRCFLPWYFACVCTRSKCDCRAISRLHLMIFEFLSSLPNLDLKMSSIRRPFFQNWILAHIVSRVSNIWPASSSWQGPVVSALRLTDATRSRWMLNLLDLDWGTNILQLATCSCCVELPALLLSRQCVAGVCTAFPCSCPRTFTSTSTCLGSCGYTIPRFLQRTLLFNALMLSVDP